MYNLKKSGKKLAYLLRHDREYVFDPHGWRSVRELVTEHGFTVGQLRHIVAVDDKQRYEFDESGKFLRARQGHTVQVDVELDRLTPPARLYHGTIRPNVALIALEGIRKMRRLYVHLSASEAVAKTVGARFGDPVVLVIDSERMAADGIPFYRSRNGVWLTDFVDSRYILNLDQFD